MNREIKFRAWNETSEEMVYPDSCGQNFGYGALKNGDILNRFDTVMQFTGRTDKNGTDIYEGDIMQYVSEYIYRRWDHEAFPPEITTGKDAVRFDKGKFVIGYFADLYRLPEFVDYGDNHYGKWSQRYKDFEVIGNIYENPELLIKPTSDERSVATEV